MTASTVTSRAHVDNASNVYPCMQGYTSVPMCVHVDSVHVCTFVYGWSQCLQMCAGVAIVGSGFRLDIGFAVIVCMFDVMGFGYGD